MYEFSEVSFDLEKSYEHILSIQVSLDGFSFSIHRPSDDVLLFFKPSSLKISSHTLLVRRFKEWIESEELLKRPYQKVRVLVFSEKFTFVPFHLQHKDVNDDLLHVLFQNANTLQFAENLVKELNAKLLFSIPDGFNQVIQNSFGECEIIHPLKRILNNVLEMTEEQVLLLLFHERNLQLVLIKNGKLLLANSFKINHVNDVVYFTLTALKQFELSSRKTKLLYTGKSSYNDSSIVNLEKQFVHIERMKTEKLKNTNELPEKILSENISLFL